MPVVIESEVWEPNPSIFIFLFCCCSASFYLFPLIFKNASRNTSSLSDLSLSPSSSSSPQSFDRFQRYFLLAYSLASVMEGMWSVFGESELAIYEFSRGQMVESLCVGYLAAFLAGPFLGVLSDLIGQKKVCVIFCGLHLFVGAWKWITASPVIWAASICLSLATSIFSFSFESWMVAEHEKLGNRQDDLSDTFWLMTFYESASYMGSQVLANSLIGSDVTKNMTLPSTVVVFLAMVCALYIGKGSEGTTKPAAFKDYKVSYANLFGDKRVWLLAWAQSSLHFSLAVFWILWAPTLVADGRDVNLGLIYPLLMGARMLGSTTFPWFIGGTASIRTENFLLYAFMIMGIVSSAIAYDYQDVGYFVTLFCLFQACAGLILPSLARLRTIYVPSELRGGMMSLSLAPANAAILFLLLQKRYCDSISNATMLCMGSVGLLSSCVCMYTLKRLGKSLHQNWHKL